MKSSFWGYLLIILGVGIIITLIVTYSFASTSETDYYLLKETTEAAMLDALDEQEYFDSCGVTVRIDKAIFVSSFLKRFSDINNYDNTYNIKFYKINESPPLVDVEIQTSSGKYVIERTSLDIPITTRIDGILDLK